MWPAFSSQSKSFGKKNSIPKSFIKHLAYILLDLFVKYRSNTIYKLLIFPTILYLDTNLILFIKDLIIIFA